MTALDYNAKTAEALSRTIPRSLLLRADQIIQFSDPTRNRRCRHCSGETTGRGPLNFHIERDTA